MKTTKIFSVIGLALMLLGMTTGFTKRSESLPSQSQTSTGIYYAVIVHPIFAAGSCGNYIIKVVDQTGRLVTPAQNYVPGIDKYSFTEIGFTIQNMKQTRMAVLEEVIIPDCPQCVCATHLYALPDVKQGPFLVGQTYTFNLYPKQMAQSTD